jgi:ubiquitin carboxyl-terminal hydrolase 5/13
MVDGLIMMFGFEEGKIRKALRKTDMNPERAVDWLLNHTDEHDSDQEMKNKDEGSDIPNPYKDEKAGLYELNSFITHLGASVDVGHYVCNVRSGEGKWKYFNDAKVAETEDPPIGKGYIYLFRKRD